MMNILISTIIRNRITTLPMWSSQIAELVKFNPDIEFTLSCYTNDNYDGSNDFLANLKIPGLSSYVLKNETLNTIQYGSWKSAERVNNLANARNQTLAQVDLTKFDRILVIEPDIKYEPKLMRPILISDYDVISARSISHGCENYDTWGSRRNELDKDWTGATPLTDTECWATFHCFVSYNVKPIIAGARFSGFNHKLNHYDCDTVCIVNQIRDLGYNKVIIKGNITVQHL